MAIVATCLWGLCLLTASPETVLYVSDQAPEGGDGSAAAPFSSLQAAQEAVRAVKTDAPDHGVALAISGAFYLPDGIEFTPEDSGSELAPVTWRSAEGSIAQLIGGLPLGNWRDEGDGVYSCPYPEGYEVGEVFENGTPMSIAARPKGDYFHVAEPVADRVHEAFYYQEGDLEPAGWDARHASVYIWAGWDWWTYTADIESVDFDARRLTLAERVGNDIRPGNRFRVLNVPEFLEEPGEYYLDPTERRIYLRPSAGNPNEATYVASTAEHVLHITGEPDAPVQYVRITDLDLSIAKGDVVRFAHAQDCELERCRISNGGAQGVMVVGHSQRVRIASNAIHDLGRHGVMLQGLQPGQPDVNSHHRVVNNHIYRGGRNAGDGSGVWISQSGHNEVLHNDIHHMPRYGTTIKGMRYQVLRTQIEGVTWENRHDFLHSRHNRIAYNRIHRVNLDSQDTGAMESWGPGRDNHYENNLIHDVGNDVFDLQMGMYLDDATDYFTVRNNIIYNVHGTRHVVGIFSKGIGNRFHNNVIVVRPPMDAALLSMVMADERADEHVYTHNILYFETPEGVIHHFINWEDNRVAESNFNCVWNATGGPLRFNGDTPVDTLEEWQSLFDEQFDADSIVADPQFMDAGAHDYRLADDSPARALGIDSIDTEAIGLRTDFPERFERP